MNTHKKIILLLVALFTSSMLIEGWRGRRGYRGRGYGRRGGWGHRGWGGRRWGWGWGAPAIGIGLGTAIARDSDYYRDRYYQDDMDKDYWSIENNTDSYIKVKTPGRGYKKIRPGDSRKIYRRDSFKVTVKGPDNQRLRFSTENHNVRVSSDNSGELTYTTWNE